MKLIWRSYFSNGWFNHQLVKIGILKVQVVSLFESELIIWSVAIWVYHVEQSSSTGGEELPKLLLIVIIKNHLAPQTTIL